MGAGDLVKVGQRVKVEAYGAYDGDGDIRLDADEGDDPVYIYRRSMTQAFAITPVEDGAPGEANGGEAGPDPLRLAALDRALAYFGDDDTGGFGDVVNAAEAFLAFLKGGGE